MRPVDVRPSLVTTEPPRARARRRVSSTNRSTAVRVAAWSGLGLTAVGALGGVAACSHDNERGTEAEQVKEWPKTGAEAAQQMGLSTNAAKYFVQGENNVWNAEFFPLQDGVSYQDGHHMKDGQVVSDPQEIFDFSAEPEWQSVTNQSESGTLFARTGGAGPEGEKNVSRFMGPDGTADNIEQAALIPAPEECVDEPHTAAWRAAAREFIFNQDAQNNVITVEWYNPTTDSLEQIDGRTISSYAETMDQDAKEAFAQTIDILPAGYPLTPEQAVAMSGNTTNPENWTFNTDTGVWTFEGFQLANGVEYDEAGGVLRKGNDIVGPDAAYNYSNWQYAKAHLWAEGWTFPSLPGVYGFARTGGGSDFAPDTSYYGVGGTVDTNGRSGFEQGAIIPVAPDDECTTVDEALVRAVQRDAQRQLRNLDVAEVKIVTPAGVHSVPTN